MNEKTYTFIPTWFEVVWNVTLSILILLLMNGSRMFRYYTSKEQAVNVETSIFKFGFLDKLDNHLTATVVTFLFWALVGLLAYVIGSVLISMFYDAESGAKAMHQYVFPNNEFRRQFVLLSINHIIIRVIACIALVLWIIVFFTNMLPICSVFFYSGLTYEINWTGFGLALLSVIALAVYLYLLSSILRLIVLRPRVFNRN